MEERNHLAQPSGFGTECALNQVSAALDAVDAVRIISLRLPELREHLSGTSTFYFPSAAEAAIKTADGRFLTTAKTRKCR